MQIIHLSQTDDREAWLEERRGSIMGTKYDKVKPSSRKVDGSTTPAGFWDLLAEHISVAPDYNKKSMDRGKEVENQAIEHALKLLNISPLEVDMDPGLWRSDENDRIGSSPDAAQKTDRPIYVFEAKCFDSGKHIKTIIFDAICKRIDDKAFISKMPPFLVEALPPIPSVYNPINSVPKENQSQVRQYFVTNPDQQIVYVVLHDDRIALESYETYVITVHREDVEGDIEVQRNTQNLQLEKIDALLKFLTENTL